MAPAAQNEKRGEPVAVYLRTPTIARIRTIARDEDRSVSQVIRRAVGPACESAHEHG